MREKNQERIEEVFAEDEMSLRSVDPHWSGEELLSRPGIYFLKDVVKILQLDPVHVKKRARECQKKLLSSWQEMGVKKVWNHWVVRMRVFSRYYRRYLVPKVRRIEADWDGNRLLKEKGLFLLSEVCKHIPFGTHQLRYRAKKNPDAKKVMGIWKDGELNAFVVDMERFAPWLRRMWQSPEESA